jgi:hypothetical protein
MRSLGKGQTEARSIATSVFNLNFNSSSKLYLTAPTVTVSFPLVAAGAAPIVNVTATAKIRTFFIGLAGFNNLSVKNFTQATRPPVILCLMLDRSGSMAGDGGSSAMPGAVAEFVNYFIEGTDQLGEVSFAWTASTDVPIATTFKTAITNSVTTTSVGGNPYTGATNAYAGLAASNLAVTGVANPPLNAVKVVVYFTDGWANTITDNNLHCDNGVTLSYGGIDPNPATVANVFNQTFGDTWAYYNSSIPKEYDGAPAPGPGNCAFTATTGIANDYFPAQDPVLTAPLAPPQQVLFSRANITTEGEYRVENLASQMRGNKLIVYTVGLANSPSGIDQTFLQTVAAPTGLYECAIEGTVPAASTGCGAVGGGNLQAAFQTIAENIILRLTQ